MKKISVFLCFAVIFASLFGSSVYAASYPTIPTTSARDHYLIVEDTAGDVRLVVVHPPSDSSTVTFYFYNSNIYIGANVNTPYNHYILQDNVWSSTGSALIMDAYPSNFNSATVKVLACSKNVYDETGKVVFTPPPVPPTLEEVVLEGVTNLQMETMTTMKTIALCGVGCLALLIGLYLLPKILYRFL